MYIKYQVIVRNHFTEKTTKRVLSRSGAGRRGLELRRLITAVTTGSTLRFPVELDSQSAAVSSDGSSLYDVTSTPDVVQPDTASGYIYISKSLLNNILYEILTNHSQLKYSKNS